MTEIKNIDLAGILSNAETIKGQRNRNRLDEILNPMKAQQAQIEIDEATRAQAVNEGKVFLSTLGDISKLPENDQQAAWANARETLRRFGSDDVDDIPELFDSQVLQGIQGVVSSGAGASSNTIQSTWVNDKGERIGTLRDGTTMVLGKAETGLRPVDVGGRKLFFDPVTRQLVDPAAASTQDGQTRDEITTKEAQHAADRAAAIKAAEEKAKIEASNIAAQEENQKAFSVYSAGIKDLESALSGANTGVFYGRLPAVTDKSKAAEGAINIMAPVLKQVFRESGEGTFTEGDQKLLLDMIPNRTDSDPVRQAKLEMIDRIVRAKMGIPAETAEEKAARVAKEKADEQRRKQEAEARKKAEEEAGSGDGWTLRVKQ